MVTIQGNGTTRKNVVIKHWEIMLDQKCNCVMISIMALHMKKKNKNKLLNMNYFLEKP
jgi:hypothetical protein